ncbi:hypothetical protein MMC25_006783 [Agyrium rufum]|nr:hypothetical protein [Agyrium rufum]
MRSRSGRRINPDHVEQIASMFPQVSRREIYWDLQRNGGGVAACSERILSGRSLDRPPPSFTLPPTYDTPSAAANATAATSSAAKVAARSKDLIQRYGLAGKLAQQQAMEGDGAANQGLEETNQAPEKASWSSSKVERQALLQRRREEMILAARRKLEEKDRLDRQREKGKGKEVVGSQ